MTWLNRDILTQQRQAAAGVATQPLLDQITTSLKEALKPPDPAPQWSMPSLDDLIGAGKQAVKPVVDAAQAAAPSFKVPSLADLGIQDAPPPTPSGTPAGMPTNAPRTGGIESSTITTGPRPDQQLRPGESVGSVTLGPAPAKQGEYRSYARQVAQQYGLDPDIFERQINQESGFRHWNEDGTLLGSSAGAQGIAQFMPDTARANGVDLNDPYSSLDGAARHMRDLLKANGGNYRLALAAYNAGQGNVDKWGEGVFDDDFAHGQTRDYVNIILGPGSARPARQSMSNAGAGFPPAASATSPSQQGGSAVPPSAAAPALHPTVAQKWEQQFGRPPTPEEAAELMGVLA